MTKVEQAKLNEISDLIIVMGERQKQLAEKDIPEIKEHLTSMNGNLTKHAESLIILNTTIYGKNGDPGLVHLVDNLGKRMLGLIICVALICGSLGYGVCEIVKLLVG